MPDRIEEILKNIHILLAKGESYQTSPDKVVISKHEMFELLEELSEAVYEVMDKYEATAHSRERARLELDRKSAELVEDAHRKADDVYAASLLYTDHMLDTINSIIDASRANVKREMIDMLARIEDQQATISNNMSAIKEDLADLHDGEVYTHALEDFREKEENKRRFGSDDESAADEDTPAARENLVIRVDRIGSKAGVSVSTKRTRGRKNRKGSSGEEGQPKASSAADSREASAAQSENASGSAPAPSGTVFTADDFDLDGEYEAWKSGSADGETEKQPASPKGKGLFSLFRRNKP